MQANAQMPHIVQKIFAHITGYDKKTVEIGNIIFNIDGDQHVDILKTVNHGDTEIRTYFLPMAKMGPDVKLNDVQHVLKSIPESLCSVMISEEKKPILGIKIEFRYNKKNVDVMYDTFHAINLKKGIIFRMYNKIILNTLQRNTDDKSLLQMAMHATMPTVVIDCGHGGDDDGAIGVGGIKEKDVNLAIGNLVAQQIKKKGFNALLTRSDDRTLSLSDRITFANKVKADLFVSIHANAAHNQAASGIETFGVVPLYSIDSSMTIDHNKRKQLVQQLVQHRVHRGMNCATAIQNSLVSYIKKIHHEVKDRSVKRAPLLVLLGTTMPAVLVEVGFVSNPQEGLLLGDQKYQSYLAHGITDGVCNYLQSIA